MKWLRNAFIFSILLISILLATGVWWYIGTGVTESNIPFLNDLLAQNQTLNLTPPQEQIQTSGQARSQTPSEKHIETQSQSQNQAIIPTEFNNKIIRVLIYECDGTSWSDIIEKSLTTCSENNLIPGISFNATRKAFNEEKKLTFDELQNYDVLIVPGGYLYKIYRNWRAEDIRSWIYKGGGYVGICAGEILAIDGNVSESIFGSYVGLNVAPNIKHEISDWVGVRNVRMTRLGTTLLGLSGDQAMYLWNGSTFLYKDEPFTSNVSWDNQVLVFAVFSDNPLDQEKEEFGSDYWRAEFNGMAAIVGNHFGKGRMILSGPHPEYPKEKGEYKNMRMLGAMVKWAFKDDTQLPIFIGRENILRQDYLAFKMGAASCLVTEDISVSKLKIYVRYGKGKGILGIYSQGEATGRPGQLLTEEVFQLPSEMSNYWQEVTLDKEYTFKKDSTIWLAWAFESMTILSSESDTLLQKGDFGETNYLECGLTWKELTTSIPATQAENNKGSITEETHLPAYFPEPALNEHRIFTCYALGQLMNHTEMASTKTIP